MDPFSSAQVGQTKLRVARFGLGTAPLGGWPAAVPFDQGAWATDPVALTRGFAAAGRRSIHAAR